jgi:Fe-S-cluster-containing hydrogenase component 2
MPGVTVTVSDRCVGCGTCTLDVCFVNAIHLKEDRSYINETCRGCGRCVAECPEGAIEITFETNRFVQDAIARISPLVDVE